MNLDSADISLAHVHAYVDAQLNDDDCERLEAYFDINPDKFEQLQQFLAINDHHQSLFEPILKEPIPQSMLERIYAEKIDPFQSPNSSFNRVSEVISFFLFEKLSVLFNDLSRCRFSFLRIDRLEHQSWFIKLRSMASAEEGQDKGAFTRFVQALKLKSETAPAWIYHSLQNTSALMTKIKNSFQEVNLFAVASIVAIGVVTGLLASNSHDPVTVAPMNQRYAESQAIQAHLFYRKEGRSALEVDKDKQHQLLNWVSGRLGKEIRLIDFSEMGYNNAGMMLVPALSNFAMVTVYKDNQGQKLTLYIGLRDADKTDDVECTPRENTKSLCSWANDKLQFVVVSDLAVAETRQLAEWMQQNYAMAHLISSNEYLFSQTLGTIKA